MNTINPFDLLLSPADISTDLAGRVRARRKEKKYSQLKLSELSGVSLGSIKRFERTGEISLSSLIKISFALECENDFSALFAKRKYRSIQEVIDEQK